MSFDGTKPLDNGYLADAPAELRENFRALREDCIVDAGMLSGITVGHSSGSIPIADGESVTDLNADLLDGYDAAHFAASEHSHASATATTAGLMSAEDKTKLDGIAAGAQVNQAAFSAVNVDGAIIQAEDKEDIWNLHAGEGITLTGNANAKSVTVAAQTISPATATTAGLMSAADKSKFDKIGDINLVGAAPYVSSGSTAKYLRLLNVDYSGGASLYLNGKDRDTATGTFSLQAFDGTNRRAFIGKPDGTLTWNGANVLTTVAAAQSFNTYGYVKFQNGFIIQWGQCICNTAKNYQIPFPTACYSIVCNPNSHHGGQDDIGITNITKTGFTAKSYSNYTAYFIAIGK